MTLTKGWAQLKEANQLGPAGGGTPFSNGVTLLMSWGPIQFTLWPLNFNEMDHETGSDWAQKEIAGAAIYREWVGENDETRYLRGDLFPYRIGGMTEIEIFDSFRRGGVPNALIGGDGRNLGWYVCEKMTRSHTFISSEGIGQKIAFEAVMVRVPVPTPSDYLPNLWTAVGGWVD